GHPNWSGQGASGWRPLVTPQTSTLGPASAASPASPPALPALPPPPESAFPWTSLPESPPPTQLPSAPKPVSLLLFAPPSVDSYPRSTGEQLNATSAAIPTRRISGIANGLKRPIRAHDSTNRF